MGYGFIQAGVYTKGQPKAQAVDGLQQGIHIFAGVAQHMQYGAKHLAAQILHAAHFDERRCNEMPVAAFGRQFQSRDLVAVGAHAINIVFDIGLGLCINHRADIGCQLVGVAHAQRLHGAAQHVQYMLSTVFLQAQQAQGRAALTCRVVGRHQHIAHDLLGQCRGVHHHGVDAAGFSNQRHRLAVAAQALRQTAVNVLCDGVRAGEHHGIGGRVADQCITHGFPVAGQQLQCMCRNSGLVQHGNCLCSYQVSLFCRFGNHHIACCQCGGNLPTENGQWEIPGADADHHTQRAMAVVVQVLLSLLGVVAQKVDGFAYFGDRVGQGFARLAAQQAHQRLQVGLHNVCCLQQGLRTRIDRCGLPNRGCMLGVLHGLRDLCTPRHTHFAQYVLHLRRVEHRGGGQVLGVGRLCRQRCHTAQQCSRQRCQPLLVAQIQTCGVAARLCGIQLGRLWNAVMRAAQWLQRLGSGDGVGDQLCNVDAFIANLVHKRAVGTVFQQTPYQIRQQGFVRAHRGINAAGAGQLAFGGVAHHLFVQTFAHAVQALELVLAAVVVVARHVIDAGQRVGVVGGKLREDGFGGTQEFAGAGEVGHIGMHLAGEDGEVFQPIHLRAFDFAVPVCTFDQAHHQAVLAAAGQINDPVQHKERTALVGLHHKANPVPAR